MRDGDSVVSEAYLDIQFKCDPRHTSDWQVVFQLLSEGRRGWQLQDAIDPISKSAADALDDVWDNLSYGNDSFEVFEASVKGENCHLRLMTGGIVYDELLKHFVPWLKSFPVEDFNVSLSGEGD